MTLASISYAMDQQSKDVAQSDESAPISICRMKAPFSMPVQAQPPLEQRSSTLYYNEKPLSSHTAAKYFVMINGITTPKKPQ